MSASGTVARRLVPRGPVERGVAGPRVLLLGLVGAVALRIGTGGGGGVRTPSAGLLFALALAGLCVAGRLTSGAAQRGGSPVRAVVTGVVGAAVLCAVPLVVHLRTPGAALDTAALPVWLVVVTAVAVAEEAFLRGALWDVTSARRGETTALVVTTVAFGLMHVPFYGLSALPLDLAVGLLLGGLRQWTGGWAAPAVAHTLADVCGWWLR